MSTSAEKLRDEFITTSIFRLDENTRKIEVCLGQLSEQEIWQRPNTSSNSVANQILHLCGNIRQYTTASLGHKTDTRERDAEFTAESGFDKNGLMQLLSKTLAEAKTVIRAVQEDELLRIRPVQAYKLSGLANVLHVVEHYSYHTGQIIFWTKQLKNKDMGFYDDRDLAKCQ